MYDETYFFQKTFANFADVIYNKREGSFCVKNIPATSELRGYSYIII